MYIAFKIEADVNGNYQTFSFMIHFNGKIIVLQKLPSLSFTVY